MDRHTQMRWSEVKVGLLLLIALALLVTMVLNLEGGVGLLSSQTPYRALVDHTQGLKVGGPVRMNGVDIGNIRSIRIVESQPMVEIAFTVQSQVASHIRDDATVIIRPMGLLGDKFLEVHPGSPTHPPMATNGVLMGYAAADLTGVASEVTATIETLNAAIGDIRQVLAQLQQGEGTAQKLLTDSSLYDRSQRVLENLEAASEQGRTLLDNVNRGKGTIGRLLTDKDLYVRADQAVRAMNALIVRLNNQESTLAKLADPTLYKRLDALTQRGERLLADLEEGRGTVGRLITDDELYRRAEKVLTDMEALVADVKAHPTKYFKFSVF